MAKREILYEGVLDLAGVDIPCYVLDDGTRVLSGRKMQEALKIVDVEEGKQSAGTRLQRYLTQKRLNPLFIRIESWTTSARLSAIAVHKKSMAMKQPFLPICATLS
ncbi:hypothetical protein [Pasteurella multocida]|uniref:hypothetical protein n=1 Tax=Pasteurella multocida TaxID=747 RepID=UPI00223E0E64|nr:hypothetical protein [Pasteurella multocida]UZJ27352.1 hypothetical protein OO003_06895 [Pasteurella multocida]